MRVLMAAERLIARKRLGFILKAGGAYALCAYGEDIWDWLF